MIKIPMYLLASVACFMAKNDVRPYLNAVLLEPCSDGGVRAVALDGVCVAVGRSEDAGWTDAETSLLISRDSVAEILRAAKDGVVEFVKRPNGQWVAVTDTKTVVVETVDGIFPDIEQLLPIGQLRSDPAFAVDALYIGKMVDAAKQVKRRGGMATAAGLPALQIEGQGEMAACWRLGGTEWGQLVPGFHLGGIVMPLRDSRHRRDDIVSRLWSP